VPRLKNQRQKFQQLPVHRVGKKTAKEPFSRLALQGINASFHYKEQAEKQSTTLHSEFLMRHLHRALYWIIWHSIRNL